jgi:hypothetical protein
VASPFLFLPGNNALQLLGLPSHLFFSHNIAQSDNGQTIVAAATSQVKLCPFDEEELAIWFRLIEVQSATAGIKSQKLRYANTLASLP